MAIAVTASVSDYAALCRAISALSNTPSGGTLCVDLEESASPQARDVARNVIDSALVAGVYPPIDPRMVEEEESNTPESLWINLSIPITQQQPLRTSCCDGVAYYIAKSNPTTPTALPAEFIPWFETSYPWSSEEGLALLRSLLHPHKVLSNRMTLTLCVMATMVEARTGLKRYFLAARCKKRRAYVCVGYLRASADEHVYHDSVVAEDLPIDEGSLGPFTQYGQGGSSAISDRSPIVIAKELRTIAVGVDSIGVVEDQLRLYECRALHHYQPDPRPPSIQTITRTVEEMAAAAKQEMSCLGPDAAVLLKKMSSFQETHFVPAKGIELAAEIRSHIVRGPWVRDTLLPLQEGGTREFKAPKNQDAVSKDAAMKVSAWSSQYLTSFANTRGGTLVYGVDDEGKVVGVRTADVKALSEAFHGAVSRIHPKVPRNLYLLETRSVKAAGVAPQEGGDEWWSKRMGGGPATAPKSSTDLIVLQFVVGTGTAPFYTAGLASTSPAWGRYVASTQAMHSSVLLLRIMAELDKNRAPPSDPPQVGTIPMKVSTALRQWETLKP